MSPFSWDTFTDSEDNITYLFESLNLILNAQC